MVAGSIGSLNVTLTGAVAETPVAPLPGDVDVTVGGTSSRVEKPNLKSAGSRLPATSLTSVVILTAIAVALGNGPPGLNSAVRVPAV